MFKLFYDFTSIIALILSILPPQVSDKPSQLNVLDHMEIACHILVVVIIMSKDWPHVKPKNKIK